MGCAGEEKCELLSGQWRVMDHLGFGEDFVGWGGGWGYDHFGLIFDQC